MGARELEQRPGTLEALGLRVGDLTGELADERRDVADAVERLELAEARHRAGQQPFLDRLDRQLPRVLAERLGEGVEPFSRFDVDPRHRFPYRRAPSRPVDRNHPSWGCAAERRLFRARRRRAARIGAIRSLVPARRTGGGAGFGRCTRTALPAVSTLNRKEDIAVSVVSMRELLEAGVHFGHQTRRWNPKMRRFIFTERGGIYIIDLQQTLELLEQAHEFARNIASRGGSVLFVGTKKQAMDAISDHAKAAGMPYVNHRWLGGLLTNWRTMSQRIERLHELRRLNDEGQLELLPAKERIAMQAEREKLEANLGGVADMRRRPDAVFIVDLRKEQLAVREARRLGLPIIALVDTNADPDEADYIVPGNDDAIRSCELIVRAIAAGIEAGQQRVTPEE